MANPAIAAAAHALAAATAQHDHAREGLVKAEAARSLIAERIEAKEMERSALIARRQAGKGQDGDGARLELIRIDLEGLAEMLKAEDANVSAALVPLNERMSRTQSAQYTLTQIEHETMEAALIEHAGKLDELMLETLQQIAALHAPLGRGKPRWAPSSALWSELRRLAAAHGRL